MAGVGQIEGARTQRHMACAAIVACLLCFATLTSLGWAESKTSGPLLNDLPPATDSELRLVMVAIEGCPFCMRWDAQVGHIYPKSDEAKVAPLVRVRFGSETLAGFKKIKYTPTFLVLRGQTEIGRIAGYPGADPFWEELGVILKPHTVQPDSTNEVQE